MIRFSCPNCARDYLLADALTGLPLLCKGCGQRLTVPEPQPEPEPVVAPSPVKPALPPPPPPAEQVPVKADKEKEVAKALEIEMATSKAISESGEDEAFLSSGALAKLDLPLDVSGGEEPQSLPSAKELPPPSLQPKPPVPAKPTPVGPARDRKIMARLVDVVVVVILLATGTMVGEVVAKKSTRQIWEEAGAESGFLSTDLLIWLGCVVFFGLVYTWLGTRGWTVGGWLRRRGMN